MKLRGWKQGRVVKSNGEEQRDVEEGKVKGCRKTLIKRSRQRPKSSEDKYPIRFWRYSRSN
jgi:hypothetical protein